MENFNNSIGFISIQNGVNNFKSLIGTETSTEAQARLNSEQQMMQKLKDAAYSNPGAFQSQFEREFGTHYSHENIENLKKKSEEYIKINAYRESLTQLSSGIKDIKKILSQEQKIKAAQMLSPAAALKMPEPSSDAKFAEVLNDFCNGDEALFSNYMQKLSSEYGSMTEVRAHFPEILENLQTNAENAYKKQLKGVDFEFYKNEYNEACKKVLGRKDSDVLATKYIENAKTQGAYAEIGVTIAASILLPGTNALKGVAKAVTSARNFITTASLPAAMTTANAATSKEGFTPENTAEIKEKLKNGFIYGGFGRFASGPLGNLVEKAISRNPSLISSVLSKTSGVAAETSADVIFDRLTSELSVEESLKTNGGMNFGMMIAGGILTKTANLSKMSVAKHADGTYCVKSEGKEVFKSTKEADIADFIISVGGKYRKLPEWLDQSNPDFENVLKLAESKLLEHANDKNFNFMLEYAEKLRQKDPNRLARLVSSKFIDTEKPNIDKVIENRISPARNGFFAKNFLKAYGKNTAMKKFNSIEEMNAAKVSPGNVCEVGKQLYVNDNGTMKPLKISAEKFKELFAYDELFNTYQGRLGDCWLVSAINGMVESPNGRAKLYQMFEEDGNDILVKMSGTKNTGLFDFNSSKKLQQKGSREYTIRFKDGEIRYGKTYSGMDGAKGLQMVEQAYALQRMHKDAFFGRFSGVKENGVTDYAQFTDLDKVLYAATGGNSVEFIAEIYNLRYENDLFKNIDNEIVGEYRRICTSDAKKCEEIIQKSANEPDTLLFASTKNYKAYKKTQFTNKEAQLLDAENSIYTDHAYCVKGYDEATKTVYYSNPHINAMIFELPLEKFLDLFDRISYIRI